MWKASKEQNRKWQKAWYYRQKNAGIIYLLIFKSGDTYIGRTTNSLQKRLWQHKTGKLKATADMDFEGVEAEIIYTCKRREDLKQLERDYINEYKPSRNLWLLDNRYTPINPILFNGERYKTKKDLWEKLGTVPYGTFKSRLHRGKSLEEALGIDET